MDELYRINDALTARPSCSSAINEDIDVPDEFEEE